VRGFCLVRTTVDRSIVALAVAAPSPSSPAPALERASLSNVSESNAGGAGVTTLNRPQPNRWMRIPTYSVLLNQRSVFVVRLSFRRRWYKLRYITFVHLHPVDVQYLLCKGCCCSLIRTLTVLYNTVLFLVALTYPGLLTPGLPGTSPSASSLRATGVGTSNPAPIYRIKYIWLCAGAARCRAPALTLCSAESLRTTLPGFQVGDVKTHVPCRDLSISTVTVYR
jgi:hypothetical protein